MAEDTSALFCDLYELTMAQAYWRSGHAVSEAVFQLFFRKAPFGSPFVVACGLSQAVDFLARFTFTPADLQYLSELRGNDGGPLFCQEFLQFLEGCRFRGDVDALPEGSVVFAGEPLLRVSGPVWQCQVVESALLNAINFESLIATKAARVCTAADGDRVVEFGMRRAHGSSGALQASRAAYVGGCHGSSNLLAGQLFGIPVSGTQAHSWIMFFESETEAFAAYAEALPNNCIFLVDTYESLSGVKHAIEASKRLRARGHEMIGIRLDSGDLAGLSRKARALLDGNGLAGAVIVASGDLDEQRIAHLKQAGACIDIWGVGSKLVTGHDASFLGGVYKLSAVRRADGTWCYKLKLSEELGKISMPGILQVRRRETPDGGFAGDIVFDTEQGLSADTPAGGRDLLRPVFRGGVLARPLPSAQEARQNCQRELRSLPRELRRLEQPTPYEPEVDAGLQRIRTGLIEQARAALATP